MELEGRRPIPKATELNVLDKSRRRCALCFQMNGDLTEKRGQIAHLDKNPANFAEDNLAWLCLDHHTLYDSRNSQHKNYTLAEVRKAREALYQAIESERHFDTTVPPSPVGRDADRHTLSEIMAILRDRDIPFLRNVHFGGGSFALDDLNGLLEFGERAHGAEHEFIDTELEVLRTRLIEAARTLWQLIGGNTWRSRHQGRNEVPPEWEDEQPERFERVTRDLNKAAEMVCSAYDDLVRAARRKLAL